jgi:ATP-dependent DNA helicase Rep
VQYLKGPLLVLGGAGSGKTSLLAYKIAWLLREYEANPSHIFALTANPPASRLLRTKIYEILGRQAPHLTISTFDELGLGLIQRRLDVFGLTPGFSLYDRLDSDAVIGRLLRETRPELIGLATAIGRQISDWKRNLGGPPAENTMPGTGPKDVAAWLYRRYEQRLRTANALDLNDLVRKAVRLLTTDPALLTEQRAQIRFLLVDEYERTTAAEHEMVRLLAGDRTILTAVGDEHQITGGARGATDNLARLRSEVTELRVVKLEQNVRSTTRIARAAAALAGIRPPAAAPPALPSAIPGQRLRVLQARSEQHEAQGIVDTLLEHKRRHSTDYPDYAIIFPRIEQAGPVESALRSHRVPYYLRGVPSLFEHAEVRDLWSYLRLICNPADDTAFLRALSAPRRDIDRATLEELMRFAAERGRPLLDCALDPELERLLTPARLLVLQGVATLIHEAGKRAAHHHPVELTRDLIAELGYQEWLRDTCNDERIAERRMKNVMALVERLRWLAKQFPTYDLRELVAKLTLGTLIQAEGQEAANDGVVLLPLDLVKGDEYKHVYVVGFEEGLLPSGGEADIDINRERRRAYAAIGCARESVTFTWTEQRRLGGDSTVRRPSRFLTELTAEDMDWISIDDGRSSAVTVLGLPPHHVDSTQAVRRR